jgi:hypothetical protein
LKDNLKKKRKDSTTYSRGKQTKCIMTADVRPLSLSNDNIGDLLLSTCIQIMMSRQKATKHSFAMA